MYARTRCSYCVRLFTPYEFVGVNFTNSYPVLAPATFSRFRGQFSAISRARDKSRVGSTGQRVLVPNKSSLSATLRDSVFDLAAHGLFGLWNGTSYPIGIDRRCRHLLLGKCPCRQNSSAATTLICHAFITTHCTLQDSPNLHGHTGSEPDAHSFASQTDSQFPHTHTTTITSDTAT